MILSGIVHTSLGGFTVMRGVAPLGDLARCSQFDPGYQRNLIETHRAEIERFLDGSNYLFFPEVILSAVLRYQQSSRSRGRVSQAAYDVLYRTGFKSNVNGLQISTVKSRLPKSMQFVGGPDAPRIAYLNLPDDELDDGLKLFRVDGNHRLSAAANVGSEHPRYRLPTPFCVVLQDDTAQPDRWDKVVFHNINAKQIPLTSEENLRLILDTGEAALFSDVDLMKAQEFGPAYYLARRLRTEIDVGYLGGIRRAMDSPCSFTLALVEFLMTRDVIPSSAEPAQLDEWLPTVRAALQRVNAKYESHGRLAENGCHGLLVSYLYFAMLDGGRRLESFSRWVLQNHIHHLAPSVESPRVGCRYQFQPDQAVDPASLVAVFESVLEARGRTIFVAMAFASATDWTFETIEKTIKQINEKHQLDIALKAIRIDKVNEGHSFTITERILEVIESSGLLIADLTLGNRNVYHEVGYLMGLNQGRGREQNNFMLIADSSKGDEELEKDIGFNLKPWQQLRFENTTDLEQQLHEALVTYYKLG